MPEVVYPTKNRTWAQVFPDLPEKCDDWVCINDILLGIAMNNRFGGKSVATYRAEFTANVENYFDKETANANGDENRLDQIAKAHGLYKKYIPLVFDNLGGAYREYK